MDIFGISESWLNVNFDDRLLAIPKYTCIRLDRSWSENEIHAKRGGGVCCYIKSDLIFSDSELSHLNKSTRNIEMLWITLNQPKMKTIIICNLYRPPTGNIADFCEVLHDSYNTIIDMYNREIEVYILGDFNINYHDTNRIGHNNIMWFEERSGLKQLTKNATRFSHNKSCIDLIYTNSKHVYK